MDRNGLAPPDDQAAARRLIEAGLSLAELERTNTRLARDAMARIAELEETRAELEQQRQELAATRAESADRELAAAAERERLAAALETTTQSLTASQADAAAAWGRYLELRNRRTVRAALGVARRLNR